MLLRWMCLILVLPQIIHLFVSKPFRHHRGCVSRASKSSVVASSTRSCWEYNETWDSHVRAFQNVSSGSQDCFAIHQVYHSCYWCAANEPESFCSDLGSQCGHTEPAAGEDFDVGATVCQSLEMLLSYDSLPASTDLCLLAQDYVGDCDGICSSNATITNESTLSREEYRGIFATCFEYGSVSCGDEPAEPHTLEMQETCSQLETDYIIGYQYD